MAEIILRSVGVLLLGACALLVRELRLLVIQPPPHEGTLLEYGVALLALACLSSGLFLVMDGPGLFRLVPRPLQDS